MLDTMHSLWRKYKPPRSEALSALLEGQSHAGVHLMARGKSPAFQFYPDAWLSSPDILLMTPSEEGAYIRLLATAWLQPDCGLPDNDDELAILSRLRNDWYGAASQRIRAKFRAEGGRLYNDRLLEERQKQTG